MYKFKKGQEVYEMTTDDGMEFYVTFGDGEPDYSILGKFVQTLGEIRDKKNKNKTNSRGKNTSFTSNRYQNT